ncbi:type II toxin-antitoxin system RelE family toxin [Nitrospira moscoviensis]|uniref:Plasmid stabilization system protein n=1 Tax=Nitrospira moscoviensis TaxID=42253 RepID=A0A0K2GB09_NITMO|nr:Plasmid stabilization system protein [Nitrospira moscoviensis]
MSYEVLLQPRARKEFLALPAGIAKQIADAFRGMEQNPRSHRAIKLSGVESYRYRVGDYRILYEIDDHARKVIVYRIKHRREAYR